LHRVWQKEETDRHTSLEHYTASVMNMYKPFGEVNKEYRI